MPASARISAEEIMNRRKLMIECKRSGDAAMVGQMQADIDRLRAALDRARHFINGPGDRPGPVLRQITEALQVTQ